MPRPVVVMSPPTAVPLDPNDASGSLPSPARSSSDEGSSAGTGAKPSAVGAIDSGRPGSSGVGGAASTICGTNTPAEASRFAAYTPYQRSSSSAGRTQAAPRQAGSVMPSAPPMSASAWLIPAT